MRWANSCAHRAPRGCPDAGWGVREYRLSLLPQRFPRTVLLDEFGCVLALYVSSALVGSAFGSQGGDWRGAPLRFAYSPLLLFVVAGPTVRLLPWPPGLTALPATAAADGGPPHCLAHSAQGTTPLILFSVGASLQPRAALAAPSACLLKLAVCPQAMWGACRLLGLHGESLRVGVLRASMPTNVLASVLCVRSDMEGPLAVGVVFPSTTLALVSLPLMLSLLH